MMVCCDGHNPPYTQPVDPTMPSRFCKGGIQFRTRSGHWFSNCALPLDVPPELSIVFEGLYRSLISCAPTGQTDIGLVEFWTQACALALTPKAAGRNLIIVADRLDWASTLFGREAYGPFLMIASYILSQCALYDLSLIHI